MSVLTSIHAISVEVSDDTLTVQLSDGSTIAAPLAWYPRLAHGTLKERTQYRLIGNGSGIHWSLLDEDTSINNLLQGQQSSESQKSLQCWLELRRNHGGH